jgi:small subunit ribosomal protein S4
MDLRRAKTKISRRLGVYLTGSIKAFQRRPYRPGQHGTSRVRTKESNFSLQLKEKQKIKALYGLREAQLRRMFQIAARSRTNTGEALLRILEQRADNILYRSAFTRSRAHARQLITHGLVRLNGKRMNIPSAQLKIGDVLEVTKGMRESEGQVEKWLKVNATKKEVAVSALPEREQMPTEINEQLIVEYYSR